MLAKKCWYWTNSRVASDVYVHDAHVTDSRPKLILNPNLLKFRSSFQLSNSFEIFQSTVVILPYSGQNFQNNWETEKYGMGKRDFMGLRWISGDYPSHERREIRRQRRLDSLLSYFRWFNIGTRLFICYNYQFIWNILGWSNRICVSFNAMDHPFNKLPSVLHPIRKMANNYLR